MARPQTLSYRNASGPTRSRFGQPRRRSRHSLPPSFSTRAVLKRSTLSHALALSLALDFGGQATVHADPLPTAWNLSPLYASDTDWDSARKALLAAK